MKHLIAVIILLMILNSCDSRFHCPICGETDTTMSKDTIDKDIETPVLLKYGEPVQIDGSIIIAYRNDAILRHTQKMERILETCSSCGHLVSSHYYTIFYQHDDYQYSTTKYFIEELGTGELICVLRENIGAIIY